MTHYLRLGRIAREVETIFDYSLHWGIKRDGAYDLSQRRSRVEEELGGPTWRCLRELVGNSARWRRAPIPLGRQAWGLPKLGPEGQDKVETGGRCLEDYARRRIILAPLRTLIPAVASTFLRC